MSDIYFNVDIIEYEYINTSSVSAEYAYQLFKAIVDTKSELPQSPTNLGALGSGWKLSRTFSGRVKPIDVTQALIDKAYINTFNGTYDSVREVDIDYAYQELINSSLFDNSASTLNVALSPNRNLLYLIKIDEQYMYLTCDLFSNLLNYTKVTWYSVGYQNKSSVDTKTPTFTKAKCGFTSVYYRDFYLTPIIRYNSTDENKYTFAFLNFGLNTKDTPNWVHYFELSYGEEFSKKATIYKKDDDEYTHTNEDGGFPNHTHYNDNIELPTIPNIDLTNLGSNLFVLTNTNLSALNEYIWNTDIYSQLKKWFANPSDTILGLSIVRCPYTITGISDIKFGNVSSGISANTISNWTEIDCGSISLTPFYDNYLDTSPYTRYELYLPHYNFIDIPDYYVRDCKLSVKYLIDYLSMSGLIIVASTNKNGITTIINNIPCNIAMSIPLTVADRRGIVDIVANTLTSATTLNPCTVGTTAIASTIKAGFEADTISHVGTLNNASALLSYPKPYLKITRSIECSAPQFNKYQGLPTWNTSKLNDFKGFTKINSVKESIDFINENMASELISILKSGIII